jgi:hypothetical protein
MWLGFDWSQICEVLWLEANGGQDQQEQDAHPRMNEILQGQGYQGDNLCDYECGVLFDRYAVARPTLRARERPPGRTPSVETI